MRSSHQGQVGGVFAELIRRSLLPCLLLVLLAGPAGFNLEAKDKEARRARKELKEKERGQAEEPVADVPKEASADPKKEATKEPAKDAAQSAASADAAKTPESAKPADKEKVANKADDTTRLAGSDAKTPKGLKLALETAKSSRDTLRKLPGYNCTFIKQEQVKKNSLTQQTMNLKFRREPFSVYLKFVDPNPGREVLYVDGRNDGKFWLREPSGLLSYMGTISLLPTSNDALKDNRYPITMIGMEKMLEVYILDWEESLKHPDTQVQQYPQAKLGEVECQMFEIVHPQQRESFKFHKSRVYFDKKTNFPIRSEQHAFPTRAGKESQLVEEYNYVDVKVVDAPVEKDFDIRNEKYGFR